MHSRQILLLAGLGVAVVGLGVWQLSRTSEDQQADLIERVCPERARSVAALGTLEPEGDVLNLAAPTLGVLGAPRISKLLVKEEISSRTVRF